MATKFLKKRHDKFVRETAGEQTVQYVKYDPVAVDSLTGDVDDNTAYESEPISLPAFIDLNPSKATREKIGLKIEFEAVLTIPVSEFEKHNITLKIGDGFILPVSSDTYYITKITKDKQVDDGFLVYLVAITRKSGGR